MSGLDSVLNFLNSFLEVFLGILSSNLNSQAQEGIVALFCLGIVIRLINVRPKIPRPKNLKLKIKVDEDG